jgi:acetyl esterase/lipase
MSIRMTVLQKLIVTFTQRSADREVDLVKARRSVSAIERRFRVPSDVTVTEAVVGGVPVRRYTSGKRTEGVVLHLHGGAYFCGSSMMAARYSAVVANGGPDVVSVDYRLAPEHPYPAALDDAFHVYAALSADPVVVAGDSAGGGLALALVQRVRDEDLPMPAGLAVFFPWADLTQSGESYAMNAGKDMLTKDGLGRNALMYAGDHDPTTPGISPLFGQFTRFPPTMITVGTLDSLLSDARNVTAALQAAGASVTLREIPGAAHGFTTLPVPEARKAIDTMAAFMRGRLARP